MRRASSCIPRSRVFRLASLARVAAILALVVAPATSQGGPALCGTWAFIPSVPPIDGGSALFAVAAVSASDAWAVGAVADAAQSYALHWDGSAWSHVPTPDPSTFRPVNLPVSVAALAHDDVWAVGSYNSSGGGGTGLPTSQTFAMHWDGSAWRIVPSPAILGGTSFNAVSALGASSIWAVGTWSPGAPGPDEAPLTARWNGSTWDVFDAPFVGNRINQLQGVSARAANDVWAVGTWRSLTTTLHILIEHWNGSAWSVVSAPDPGDNDQLLAIAALAANDAWAVGERHDPAAGSQPLIMHWNGTSWSTRSLPALAGGFNRLNSVRAISASDVWACGATASVAGGSTTALLMHWDGSSWSVVPAPSTNGSGEYLSGLALVGECDVWAVGSYVQDGLSSPLTERLRAPGLPPVDVPPGAPSTGGAALLALETAPNPAHDGPTVTLVLSRPATVRTEVLDASGRALRLLDERVVPAGRLVAAWDGRDDRGARVSPGVYFIRARAGADTRVARVVLR